MKSNEILNFKKEGFLKELGLVYLMWLLGQVLANSLMTNQNTYRLGNIIYYIVVVLTAVIIPIILCKQRNINIKILPDKLKVKGIISSIILFGIMIFFGIQALGDNGLVLDDVFNKPISYHLSFILIFIPTMLGYMFLWYGYVYNGILNYFGENRKGKVLSVLIAAFLFAVYHITSLIDLYGSVGEMMETILYTFIIGLLIGINLLFEKSLLPVLIALFIINFFVFFHMEIYHLELQFSFEGIIVLIMIVGIIFLLNRRIFKLSNKIENT